MAVDTFPLHSRQTVCACELEATTGSPETLVAADAVLNIYNAELIDETEVVQRQGQGSSSPIPSVPAGYAGRMRFEVDLATNDSGAFLSEVQDLLAACGMTIATNTVATFITGKTAADTVTLGIYEDGVLRTIYGAVGTWTVALRSGAPARWQFEFLGLLGTDADATNLAPTYSTVLPPRFAGGACTYDSHVLRTSEMVIAANNELGLREDANNVAGFRSGIIGGRRPTITLDPEAVLVATKNWQTYLRASTEAAFSAAVGATANKIITFAAPKAQVVSVARGTRNGFYTSNLELQLNRSAAAGEDELTVTAS